MIALQLSQIKNCMAHLLLKNTFDHFSLIEGEIVTANTFTIDGYIQKNFFENNQDSLPSYTCWGDLRDYCFSIIKGKRTPLSFKFIFSCTPDDIQKLITSSNLDLNADEVQGLYLNIRFDGEQLLCITGVSFKTFSLDKMLEKAWDSYVKNFFENAGIASEEIQ